MQVTCVTSAFLHVRPDRPPEYYTVPLTAFLSAVEEDSSLSHIVYTEPESRTDLSLPTSVKVRSARPEDLLREVWDEPNWMSIYGDMIRMNPTHRNSYQARFPGLIAVYLGKVAMIARAFADGADCVFWHDAGHWVSYQAAHDFGKYDPMLQNGVVGKGLGIRLLAAAEQHGVVGCEATRGKVRFHMPLEWMYSYAPQVGLQKPGPLCSAVFWVVSKAEFNNFVQSFKHWWSVLIDAGKAGIEENALTLLTWRQRYPVLPYTNWISVLEGAAVDLDEVDLDWPPDDRVRSR